MKAEELRKALASVPGDTKIRNEDGRLLEGFENGTLKFKGKIIEKKSTPKKKQADGQGDV